MKKSRLTKLLAVILSLTLAFGSFGAVTAGASSAYPIISGDSDNPIGVIFSDIIESLLNFILGLFAGLFDDGPGFVPSEDAYDKAAQNYYSGIGNEFKTSADADAQWNIGYANTSLIPDDYSNGTYYIGGYIAIENGFSNVVEGIAEIPGIGKDDMKVRCVSINDGTDRGTVLFATIDCIGITNADIKDIRARLATFAEENNIASINVSSTHTHSCIDTEGLWTKLLYKLARNGIISGTGADEELIQGTNPAYMEFLKDSVADTLVDAYEDMQPGVLTYTEKDLGQDYFNNKNRPSSGEMIYEINEDGESVYTGEKEIAMTDISRFIFIPDDETATPTMMINIAAHPDVAGLPTESNSGREISGDYLFYCGKFLEDAGYNFMFFQGAIAGIYMSRSVTGDGVPTEQRVEESQRYGYELARMALALTMTKEEVEANDMLNCAEEIAEYGDSEYYSIWYENWNKDEEGNDVIPEEQEVEPFLNLLIKQVEVPVSNNLIEAVGKLNMANYVVITNDDGTYSTITEIGYMELGNQFKTVFLPGEICQDLVAPDGASLVASNSVTAKPFSSKPACDIFGNDVKCFGLMNDAIGYVVPDNDYTNGDPVNHYHELISLGRGVASALMNGLIALSEEIVRV
ncbi:MAG: hypothetical protein E7529_04810 [Ruminococcaceae bacterium]|nr:hypothetical protein [Oscillospiraceae bacterium]